MRKRNSWGFLKEYATKDTIDYFKKLEVCNNIDCELSKSEKPKQETKKNCKREQMEKNSDHNNNRSNNKCQRTRKWCSNCRMNNHNTSKCTADKWKKKDLVKSKTYTQEQVNAMISSLKVSKDKPKKKRKVQYKSDASSDDKPSLYFTQHSKTKRKHSSEDLDNYFMPTSYTESNLFSTY